MSEVPLRPSRERTPFCMTKEHASTAASATHYVFKNKSGRRMRIDHAMEMNATGLATDGSNYFVIAVKQGSVVVASKSTAAVSLASATWTELTLSTTDDDLIIEPDEEVTLTLTKTGTQTLPAGTVMLQGQFI